jgi:hypothetical protein
VIAPRGLVPSPPLCAHEPILRRGLEAAHRLIWGYRYVSGEQAEIVCEHNVARAIPCSLCDRQHVAAAVELIQHQNPPLADNCLAPKLIEARGTIDGLVLQVVGLKHANRESGEARDRALEAVGAAGPDKGRL